MDISDTRRINHIDLDDYFINRQGYECRNITQKESTMNITKKSIIICTIALCGIAYMAAGFFLKPNAVKTTPPQVLVKDYYPPETVDIQDEKQAEINNDLDLRISIENDCIGSLIETGKVFKECK